MIDDELRQHLRERSHDVPDVDAMRERVRNRLDQGTSTPRRRGMLIGCGVAATFAVVVFALGLENGSEVTDVAAEHPVAEFEMATALPQGATFTAVDMAVGVELTLPDGAGEPQVVDSRHLSIPLADDDSATLHLLFPENTSVGEAETKILSSASDTEVKSTESVAVGERIGRRLVLASGRGTSQVAYQVGFATYLRVSGVDRRHDVLVLPVQAGRSEESFVMWIDLPRDGDAQARARAVDIISSIAVADRN